MKHGRIQAKDLDEGALMAFFRRHGQKWTTHRPCPSGVMPSVADEVPGMAGVPEKVLRAKLGAMARRGLINGCDCGCRGDWHLRA